MSQQKSLLSISPLFLVLFIDGMGFALLLSILNGIIVDPASHFLPVSTSPAMRDFIYGFTISIFMLCWFFGAAILGDLSDKIGRKKALMLCLFGAFLGYLISGVGVLNQSLALLLIGRAIAGFSSGSQPIAQAAIVDISLPEHKTRNIGLVLLSCSLGFICGPIIGGVLSDPNIYHGFSLSTPLYFASVLSLFNALLLKFSFKETCYRTGKISIRWHQAVHVFISAFQHKQMRFLSLAFFAAILGWGSYFSFITLYMSHIYHFNILDNSLLLTVMGVGFSLGFGVLAGLLSKWVTLKRLTLIALLITSASILVLLLSHSLYIIFLMVFICGTSMPIAYAGCVSIFSNQVGPDEQGWIMGVTSSINALGYGVSALFIGMVAAVGVSIPLVFAVIFLVLSALVLMLIKVKPSVADPTS